MKARRLGGLMGAVLGLGLAAGQAPAQEAGQAPDTTSAPPDSLPHFVPLPDRWRDIKPPPYELNVDGHWYDPYNQNTLKGDYPILGQHTFLALTAVAENEAAFSRSPTPSGVSADRPDSQPFFGRGERSAFLAFLKLSLELYHGDVAFRPRDWEIKVTPALSLNRVNTRENNNVNINPRKGTNRGDSHLGFQELSVEKHLFNVSDRYDFVSLRLGIQRFGSDFRQLVFSDNNLGARLFGNAGGNRWQYNVAVFRMLEKDTNSELNTVFEDRRQTVAVFNLYRQDTFTPGYTAQVSVHYNHDEAGRHVDENGVPVRPAILGNPRPHDIKAYYLGWTGDGHFGRWNVSHALYQVFGKDDFNSLAGRDLTLNARMASLELSIDRDWQRYRVSGLYASGDADPMNETAVGFDAIVDQPFFAGEFGYWNQQAIRLLGVNLVNRLSLLPTLRSSKLEGQANFVNPGLILAGLGYDADVAPKIKASLNVNYLSFAATGPLEVFVHQPDIRKPIGIDMSLGLIVRPLLNNNAIVKLGAAVLVPMGGFNDIYESPGVQYSTIGQVVITY